MPTKKELQEYKEDLQAILLTALRKADCYLFLFGSHATPHPRERSDFDIGILAKKFLDFGMRYRLGGYVEGIPMPVDIVDFYRVDDDFKRIALRHIELWKRSKSPKGFKFNPETYCA